MARLLSWNVTVGLVGLRLLCLHLLWIGWTLRGGVLLGIFPATAAVHAVLRADVRRADHVPGELPELRGLSAQFREHWHREFGSANRLGALLAVLWAVVLFDRAVVSHADLGALGPVLEGAHTVGGLLLGALTLVAWPLQAHFDDGALALLRRCGVLMLGRPGVTAMTALAGGAALYAYVLVPGLVPVFGIVAPAALATLCLHRRHVLATADTAVPPHMGAGGPVPAPAR